MAPSGLEEKIAFFDALDRMVNDDSDSDDADFRKDQEMRSKSRAFFAAGSAEGRQGPAEPQPPRALKRISSAPTPASRSSQAGVIKGTPFANKTPARLTDGGPSLVEDTAVPETARGPSLMPQRSVSNPVPSKRGRSSENQASSSPSVGPATKKRKRSPPRKVIPEANQIFKGLSFYYIPNDDIAPARRLRINKAREYGAQWARELSDATHVIVDRKLAWRDIEPTLSTVAKLDSLAIVTEEYPLDCLRFRQLCNPNQHRYKISGCPVPAGRASDSGQDTPAGLDEPLQAKAKATAPKDQKKRASILAPETPPRPRGPPAANFAEDLAYGESVEELRPRKDGEASESRGAAVIPSSQGVLSEIDDSQGHDPGQQRHGEAQQSGLSDELSECIGVMQESKDLPLDQEEDESTPTVDTGSETVSDSEEELDEKPQKTRSTSGPSEKIILWKDRFACNQGGTLDDKSDSASPNARTIKILEAMCDHYGRVNDHWRTIAYRKAIAVLQRQPSKILTEEQAFKLPGVGPRLAQKIEEIVTTDRLRRLEYAQIEPADRVLQTFLGIYGVGNAQASKWIGQGFQSLEDLVEKAKLTPNQRLGIEHYDDLNTRIPRQEVKALGDYVKTAAAGIDPEVELVVGGSYRRGAKSSGDIDFIVTKKGSTSAGDLVPFLEGLVARLTREGFLTAVLASLHAQRSGKGRRRQQMARLLRPAPGAGRRQRQRRLQAGLAAHRLPPGARDRVRRRADLFHGERHLQPLHPAPCVQEGHAAEPARAVQGGDARGRGGPRSTRASWSRAATRRRFSSSWASSGGSRGSDGADGSFCLWCSGSV